MWSSLCWWRPPSYLRRVIVNFTHSESEAMAGILWRQRGPWLILRDCSALKAGRPPEKLPPPGEVHVLRDKVAYLQVDQ